MEMENEKKMERKLKMPSKESVFNKAFQKIFVRENPEILSINQPYTEKKMGEIK